MSGKPVQIRPGVGARITAAGVLAPRKAKIRLQELACRTGIRPVRRRLVPSYPYAFDPVQLMYLCDCLEQVRDVPGAVVEIGCSAGHTTLFLNQYLGARGIEKPYLCIDTFSGFTRAHIDHEVALRGKDRVEYDIAWKDSSLDLFRLTLVHNGLRRVQVVREDISRYEFPDSMQIAFCLVDVDLYLPVRHALDKVLLRLSPGGVIVVDDCSERHKYDGARQAYSEFVRAYGLPERYSHGKLATIRPFCERLERRVSTAC